MQENIATTNNEIIREKGKVFIDKINASRRSLGIKHNRKDAPKNNRIKYRQVGGEINRISVSMMKGDIMTHKGEGANKANRIAKPFYTPHAEEFTSSLADDLAMSTGDIICGNLVRV